MIEAAIWDCTGTEGPLLYKLFLNNDCTMSQLRREIEVTRNKLQRASQKNFVIYKGNMLINESVELLSFITDFDKVSNTVTFTIYDENYVLCNINIVKGLKCGKAKFIPLWSQLFKKKIQIEISDQEDIGVIKQLILGKLTSKVKIKARDVDDRVASLAVMHKGICLEDDVTIKSIYCTNECQLVCIILYNLHICTICF